MPATLPLSHKADCPEDSATYIHRVGRTARYLASGRALLLLVPSEREGMLKLLEEAKVSCGATPRRTARSWRPRLSHSMAPAKRRSLRGGVRCQRFGVWLARLSQVPLSQIKPNPAKQQAVSSALQALLSKDQTLKASRPARRWQPDFYRRLAGCLTMTFILRATAGLCAKGADRVRALGLPAAPQRGPARTVTAMLDSMREVACAPSSPLPCPFTGLPAWRDICNSV